jgi:DNA-binding CsgD family transcriptional regulator
MRKNLLLIVVLFLTNFLLSQTINPIKLQEEILKFNNEQKYDHSIIRLDGIINDSKSQPIDIYNAYLQKALTYKRLFNYAEVLENLGEAKIWALKSPIKEKALSRIKVEELFINFDLMKFEEVQKQLVHITDKDVENLDHETKAFYIGLLAVMDMRNGNFLEAEHKLDESIKILEVHSPKDLPNIYRKKIALYGHLKNEEKALESYRLGVEFAEKYNTGVYKIGIHDAMSKYYQEVEDYKKAIYYHTVAVDEFSQYNTHNANDKLKVLERDLMMDRKNTELEYEKKVRIIMIALVIILLAFLILLYKLFRLNKVKRRLMESENIRMREELEKLSREINEKGEAKINLNSTNFTERQLQIIELVKQGKTNKEIGSILFISENTVKYHLKIIYNSLGIENRYDL